MMGTLDVDLTFTGPTIIRGSVICHKQYQNFFSVPDYSITVDNSKVDKNKLASAAVAGDFTNAIVPSPAILKYGGSPTITVYGADDAKGTLTVNCHYPSLITTIPILDYHYTVSGYKTTSSYSVNNW